MLAKNFIIMSILIVDNFLLCTKANDINSNSVSGGKDYYSTFKSLERPIKDLMDDVRRVMRKIVSIICISWSNDPSFTVVGKQENFSHSS